MNTGIIGITDTKCFFDPLSRSSRVKQDFRFSEQFLSKIQVYGIYQTHKNHNFGEKFNLCKFLDFSSTFEHIARHLTTFRWLIDLEYIHKFHPYL